MANRQGPYSISAAANRYMGSHIATPSSASIAIKGKGKGGLSDDLTQNQRFILQYTQQAEANGKGKGEKRPFGTFVMTELRAGTSMTMVSCDHHAHWENGIMIIEPPFPCPHCMPRQPQHVIHGQPAQRAGYADWKFPTLPSATSDTAITSGATDITTLHMNCRPTRRGKGGRGNGKGKGN